MHIQSYTGFECPNCKQIDRRELDICPHCGFPKGGTETDKEVFYNNLEIVRNQIRERHDNIFQAKLSLSIIALINFVFALLYYIFNRNMNDAELVLIINILSAVVFLLLSFVAKEKPFTALACGTVMYLIIIAYQILGEQPDMLFNLLGRDIFMGWLLKGLNGAREVEELKKELAKRLPK